MSIIKFNLPLEKEIIDFLCKFKEGYVDLCDRYTYYRIILKDEIDIDVSNIVEWLRSNLDRQMINKGYKKIKIENNIWTYQKN